MRSNLKFTLGGAWLLVCSIVLLLPIFIPTSANPQSFIQNVIGFSTVSIFVLSFPISLFGMPLLYVSQVILGVDPDSIGGMYLNLFLLFVLGLVQWFWIVPNVFRRESGLQLLELPRNPKFCIAEPKSSSPFDFFDSESRTPLERVFQEKDME